MIQRQDILDYLANNKELFQQKYSIIKIGIFGSFARNEQNDKSDIDIIIEMPLDATQIFEKKQELREILKQTFHREIDICRERSIKPMFKKLILKDAVYV